MVLRLTRDLHYRNTNRIWNAKRVAARITAILFTLCRTLSLFAPQKCVNEAHFREANGDNFRVARPKRSVGVGGEVRQMLLAIPTRFVNSGTCHTGAPFE
jgi:GMP synthase PP-ATPase subunit